MARHSGDSGEGVIMASNGEFFDFLNPTKEQIDIDVIAHALSKIDRANGQYVKRWTVAQHSMLVSSLAEETAKLFNLSDYMQALIAMAGLLHDASEAYITDLPSPIKYLDGFEKYREIEYRIQMEIYGKYGIPYETGMIYNIVKDADHKALQYEFRTMMKGWEKMPWCYISDEEISQIEELCTYRWSDLTFDRIHKEFIFRFDHLCRRINQGVIDCVI